MLTEIFVGIAVLIFLVLAVVIICTLYTVRNTLRRIDVLCLDVSYKLQQMESTFDTISNLGEISQQETEKLKNFYQRRQEVSHRSSSKNDDLADWLIASLRLGSKFFSRRQ